MISDQNKNVENFFKIIIEIRVGPSLNKLNVGFLKDPRHWNLDSQ